MQTLVVAAAVHQAAGKFVNNDDLIVLDHVVHVPAHDTMGTDGLVNIVVEAGVVRIGQVFHVEVFLRLGDAPGSEGALLPLFLHHVVVVLVDLLVNLLIVALGDDKAAQAGDKAVCHLIELVGLVALAGDNEGGTGLVDEDGVHLVHDGKVLAPLDQIPVVDGHVISQIVKADLIVGAVGNVGGIGILALLAGQAVDDQAHLETHKAVDLTHPLRVTLGQIVVDGDDMHTVAAEGVQIGGQGSHQGLAFAGLHLGNTALMEDDAADELHPVRPHAQHTVRCLPNGGKRLREQVVQRLAVCVALLKLRRLGLQLLVGKGLILIAQGFDLIHQRGDLLDLTGG